MTSTHVTTTHKSTKQINKIDLTESNWSIASSMDTAGAHSHLTVSGEEAGSCSSVSTDWIS